MTDENIDNVMQSFSAFLETEGFDAVVILAKKKDNVHMEMHGMSYDIINMSGMLTKHVIKTSNINKPLEA